MCHYQSGGIRTLHAMVAVCLIPASFEIPFATANECNTPLLISASVGPNEVVTIDFADSIETSQNQSDADAYAATMHRIHQVPSITDAVDLALDLYLTQGSADNVIMMVGGQDRSWALPVSGDWADASNWNPIGVPDLTDNVTIRGDMNFAVDLSSDEQALCVEIGNDVAGRQTQLALSGNLDVARQLTIDSGGWLNLMGGRAQVPRTMISQFGLASGFGDLRSRVINNGVVHAIGGELVIGRSFENGPTGMLACDDQATLRFGDGDGVDPVTTGGRNLVLPRPANDEDSSATYVFSSNAPVNTAGGSIRMESTFFPAMLNGIFNGPVSTEGGDVRFSTMCPFGSCADGETLAFHGGLETMGGDLTFDVDEDLSLESIRLLLTNPVDLGSGAFAFRYEDTLALVQITDDLTAGSFEVNGDVFENGDAFLLLGNNTDDRIDIAGLMRVISGFAPVVGHSQIRAGSLDGQWAMIIEGSFARGGLNVFGDTFLLFFAEGSDMVIGGNVNHFGGQLDINLDVLGSDITLTGDNTVDGFWSLFSGDIGSGSGSVLRVPGKVSAHDGGQLLASPEFPVEINDTGSIDLVSGFFEAQNVNFTGGGVLHVGVDAILEVCNVTFDVDLQVDGTIMTAPGCPVSTAERGISGAENIIELPGSKLIVKKQQRVRREGISAATVTAR